MRTLIVYYSFTGNNQTIAGKLRERLNCDIDKIETKKARSKFSIFLDLIFNRRPAIYHIAESLHNYERFIFISPIWAGRIASPLRTFLSTYNVSIHRYSFLSVCGGGQGNQKERVTNELTQLVGKPPFVVAELEISSVVPAGKNHTRMVSDFRLNDENVDIFQEGLDAFVKEIECHSSVSPVMKISAKPGKGETRGNGEPSLLI
jgi:flavodoxin